MLKAALRFFIVIGLVVTAATSGSAQNATQPPGSVASPVLSFVADSSGGLRPLIGIAGSASVGPALNLNIKITQLAVTPGRDYMLANTTNGVALLRAQGNAVTVQAIGGFAKASGGGGLAQCYRLGVTSPEDRKISACDLGDASSDDFPAIDKIVLSSTGSAAALYSASERRVYSLSNLPQSPVLAGTFDLSGLGEPSALGISDDGRTIGLGIPAGDAGALFLWNLGQAAQPLGSMKQPAAIGFLRGSRDAIVADGGTNTIYRVSNGQMYEIAGADDGISAPMAIALSSDNQRVFVGNAQSGSVTTLSLSDGRVESTFCHCTPAGLYPTNTDSVFRLTDYSGAPVLLFDGTGARPRIVFAAGSQF